MLANHFQVIYRHLHVLLLIELINLERYSNLRSVDGSWILTRIYKGLPSGTGYQDT
jgi:hypothetical protein